MSNKTFILVLLVLFPLFWSCKTGEIHIYTHQADTIYGDRDNKYFLISDLEGDMFLLDTGSSDSYVFTPSYFSEKNIGQQPSLQASVNKQKGYAVCKASKIIFKSFSVENFKMVYIDHPTPITEIDPKLVGIIGMDVLGKEKSYWNVKHKKFILGFDSVIVQQPKLTLKYDKHKIPQTKLQINGIFYQNILLDTGYYNFLGLFPTSETQSMFGTHFIQTTNWDILGNENTLDRYTLNSIVINGRILEFSIPVHASIGNLNLQMLGYEFFAYWDFFILDPRSKEFRFYKK